MQLRDGTRHVFFEQLDDGTRRQPGPQGGAWTAPRALDPRNHPSFLREALVHQHEEQVHFEQLTGLLVEMGRPRPHGRCVRRDE